MRLRVAAALAGAAVAAAALVAIAPARPQGAHPAPPDRGSKQWRTLERSPLKRTEVAAARIGRFIYVVGGFLQPGGQTTDKVARYDIRRDRWKLVAPMPLAVNHAAATAWAGRLYVQGGFASATGLDGATSRLFEYEPKADRWIELPSAGVPRAAHALQAIDGRLYAAGGANSQTEQLTSLEIYDIQSRTWSAGADMPTGRNHVASAVVDGCMYVLGGRPPLNLSVVEHYDPATDSWKTVAPLPVARSGFAAAVVGRRVVVFGGEAADGTIAPVDAYDADADTWAGLPAMRTPRHGLGGAARGNRVFALEGGPEPGFAFSRAAEYLDVP
jgi:N-acetylneuraminic acid mutarotase